MIDLNEPLTREEAASLCDKLARRVVGLKLVTPVILFLDMHRPLARLAGQAVLVASPVMAPVFGIDGVGEFSRLLYHEGGTEKLIQRIEELSESDNEDAA